MDPISSTPSHQEIGPVIPEMRLAWDPAISHDDEGVFKNGGEWYPDRPEIWTALTLILKEQTLLHGEGTHWIETRQF